MGEFGLMKLACLKSLLFLSVLCFAHSSEEGYPPEWWAPVDPTDAPSWEILPQDAGPGEVILSKRTELGIFSNFAATEFLFEDFTYASVEGFWQMMKYPDSLLRKDPRKNPKYEWDYSRLEVAALSGFVAKDAGNAGSRVMTDLDINWVSYKGKKMPYRTSEKGEHYDLIRKAMRAKLDQHEEIKNLLIKTGDLVLRPDHDQGANPPPAWEYFKIWMEFRSELLATH
ncbi:MAG: NADAR family protein [Bdellovibrionota bacterium]